MATQVIVRHDDADGRLSIEQYQQVHELFLKRNLVETFNLQFSQFGCLNNFPVALIRYLKETPNYDIQLHGWDHQRYADMSTMVITRDLAAAYYFFMTWFGKPPSVWYPPWNSVSPQTLGIAEKFGMKIDAESYDLKKFLRETDAGTYKGHSVYFHGYQAPEMLVLPQVLDRVLQLKEESGIVTENKA